MSTTVAPEKILKELTALWVSQGREGEGPHAAGVLRACSITLVVLAESGDDASALGETIAALMPEHPARAIVISVRRRRQRQISFINWCVGNLRESISSGHCGTAG